MAQLDAYMILEAKDLPNMKPGPVRGETTDKALSDLKAIEITSFNLSGQFDDTWLDESVETKSKSAPARNDKLTLSVSKNLDRSSPALMIAFCHQRYKADPPAKAFPKLTIVLRRAGDIKSEGETQTPYLQLVFEEVRMESYDCGGSHGSNADMPTEQMTFEFKKFSMQYWSQLATGKQSNRMKIVEWNFFRESR